MAEHYLDNSEVHAYWDNSLHPRLTVKPGDTVTFECRDASDGQIKPGDHVDVLRSTDFSRIHPLTGPVGIEEASPGDALEIQVLELLHEGCGWNAIRPGFGLLAQDFTEPYLHHWHLVGKQCFFGEGTNIAVPYEPFCGVMGVAPLESGRLDTTPPRPTGGNLDIKSLVPGSTLWLPVQIPGALFSVGDCHAAQGDGEVCGNGIEAPMTVTLRFVLHKGVGLDGPKFRTPPPASPAGDHGYYATTAHGTDLYKNAQNAIRQMIEHLGQNYGLSKNGAYVICSAAVDLRISQVVNEPMWLVSAYLPLGIFES